MKNRKRDKEDLKMMWKFTLIIVVFLTLLIALIHIESTSKSATDDANERRRQEAVEIAKRIDFSMGDVFEVNGYDLKIENIEFVYGLKFRDENGNDSVMIPDEECVYLVVAAKTGVAKKSISSKGSIKVRFSNGKTYEGKAYFTSALKNSSWYRDMEDSAPEPLKEGLGVRFIAQCPYEYDNLLEDEITVLIEMNGNSLISQTSAKEINGEK